MGFPPLPNTFAYGDSKWSTATGSTGTDHSRRVAYAPTDHSAASRYARAHTNATVRHGHDSLAEFSESEGIPLCVAQATEFARISALLEDTQSIAHDGAYDPEYDSYDSDDVSTGSAAIDINPPDRLPSGALQFYESNDDILAAYDLAARSVIGGKSQDWQRWHEYLRDPLDPEAPDYQRRRLFRSALSVAVHDARNAIQTYEDYPNWDHVDMEREAHTTERAADFAWHALSQYLNRDETTDTIGELDKALVSSEYDDADYDVPWCQLIIVRPTLTVPHSAALRRRSWRMSDEGSLIRSPHRACSDGYVFGTVRKKPDSGSVLIDTSGSMSLRSTDVEEIMHHLPGVTMATYCSDAYRTGELRIIANKGRRAAPADMSNDEWYGNGVDGPALRWLAKQPKPRYWVCDGVVTGHDDQTCSELREECHKITRRYDIERISSMYQLRDKFST